MCGNPTNATRVVIQGIGDSGTPRSLLVWCIRGLGFLPDSTVIVAGFYDVDVHWKVVELMDLGKAAYDLVIKVKIDLEARISKLEETGSGEIDAGTFEDTIISLDIDGGEF